MLFRSVIPASSPPRNRIEPAVGRRAPDRQLKRVVFPEPFGPMSPRISPSSTSNETPQSAVNPPKRLVRAETLSNAPYLAANGEEAGRGSTGSFAWTLLGKTISNRPVCAW